MTNDPNYTAEMPLAAPQHGDRGAPSLAVGERLPRGWCIAISRQVGARGSRIAHRLGRMLGWQVFEQELLDYLASNDTARMQLIADLPVTLRDWADGELSRIQAMHQLTNLHELGELPRMQLMLAAQGGVIFVGRGAGFLLRPEATLHVRLIAPREERIAYMTQHLRLTHDEAARLVEHRDATREEFLKQHFSYIPPQLDPFDLVLNTSQLGEEGSARVLLEALRARQGHEGTGDAFLPPTEEEVTPA